MIMIIGEIPGKAQDNLQCIILFGVENTKF